MKTNLRVRKRRYLNQCELHVCEEMFVQMNAEKKTTELHFLCKETIRKRYVPTALDPVWCNHLRFWCFVQCIELPCFSSTFQVFCNIDGRGIIVKLTSTQLPTYVFVSIASYPVNF